MIKPKTKDYNLRDNLECNRFIKDVLKYIDYLELSMNTINYNGLTKNEYIEYSYLQDKKDSPDDWITLEENDRLRLLTMKLNRN